MIEQGPTCSTIDSSSCELVVQPEFKPTNHPSGPPPPPPPGYYPPPPPGYYQPPPPGYYPPQPQGNYYQQPAPGYYYPPPPQDVGQRGQVYIDHRPPPTQPPSNGGYRQHAGRQESIDSICAAFDDRAIRAAFIRKVYAILSLQLAFTTGVIAVCVLVESIRDFVRAQILLILLAVVVELATYIALVCCNNLRRLVPWNFILLTVFTLAMAYVAGALSAFYSTYIVLCTFAITCIVCVLVSLIAVFSCVDITDCGAVLCIISLCIFVFGIFALVLGLIYRLKILFVVYSGLVALLMCVYLMYDTQQIIGGRRVELSPEEYILGAICLYTDIVQMFLELLRVVGFCCGDE